MSNKVGRPLKFKTAKELQEKIDAYFEHCDTTVIKRIVNSKNDLISEIYKPYTITGLASFLDTNRQTLINYSEKSEFFDTIKRAKAKIEENYEFRGLIGDAHPTMTIFTLKNNFSWKDKQETDLTTGGEKIDSLVTYRPERKKDE